MGGEEHHAGIDQRSRADETVLAEEHADACNIGRRVKNVSWRRPVGRHDGRCVLLRQCRRRAEPDQRGCCDKNRSEC